MGITFRFLHFLHLLRLSAPAGILATGLVLAAVPAAAQSADPPLRVARFEASEGSVQFQSAANGQTLPADPRWPLTTGDRVITAAGARAELHVGDATVRVGDSSDMAFTVLDERMAQVRLNAGTVGLVVRDLQAGDRVEIDTPNLALVIDRPGRWRLDVDPARNTTRITAEQGSGTLYGENGQASQFSSPQSRDFAFRSLAESAPLPIRVGDAFERWAGERDRLAAQSQSLRYASADIPGVAQLDAYGDWGNDNRYGAIWFPRAVASDWAPYRNGHWQWIDPWGWTWIDDAPWGFAPFHYGRWTQAGNRWGWVPGPQQQRPAYAPAVVGFVGGMPPGAGAPPGVGWFPLAPGERWKPPFAASPGYIASLNRAGFAQDNTNGYYYQTRPGAVTMVPTDEFGRRGNGGSRPWVPNADQLAVGRPMLPPSGPGLPRLGGSVPQPMMQPLPATAPLSDRVRQDQWERDQRTRQDQYQADMLRQQQTREAQQRFQPSYGQREQQQQREQVERQQQQIIQQQQQFQQRQQQGQVLQQQQQRQQQEQLVQQQQRQFQQQQQQQQQAVQQQQRQQLQQVEQQQRQLQAEQTRQAQQQQIQQQQQQPAMHPGGGMQRSQPGEPQQQGARRWPGQQAHP